MSVEAVARKWHDQLLRTDPIDHGAAEAAVRSVYRAAEIPEPEHFLWCSSPVEAVWAYLVLVGKTEGYSHAVYQDVERSKNGKDKLSSARATIAERLGIGERDVEGYFGKPFYVAEGSNPVTKKLQANYEAWMARAQAGDDFLKAHSQGPFKPLHDREHELHFEGERRGHCSLFREALSQASNKHLAILGGRSAQHRLYGNLAFVEIAQDEALSVLGKLEPTDLQRALWAAYEATGMWWPCHRGVVFAERPSVSETSGDSVGMAWSDGLTVGELRGERPVRAEPVQAARVSMPAKADAAILSRKLPADHEERLAVLREAGPLPFLDRYRAGEHEQVWKELVALGDEARSDAHAADALAVAYETMHRVERNVRLLAERLKEMNYRFVYPGSGGGVFGFGKFKAHEPLVAPPADIHRQIAELEDQAGGSIPLSLRAFFELVGEVNFNGDHPSIAPKDSAVTPDPLMVCSARDAIAMTDADYCDQDDPIMIEFAPDALHKANVSGGAPYSIVVPDAGADALVEDEPHNVTFVEYLRIAIAWGGFPGWEGQTDRPPELDRLREGLIPF